MTTPTITHATEIVLPGKVEPHGLLVTEREVPAPTAHQALVRVDASGVSFAEQQMRRGKYYDQPAFPFVPGYDLVGTVIAVGDQADPNLVGRRVAALTKIGGWSSHVLLDAADLVRVPEALDPAEAETFVVNGITAYQMLFRHTKVRPGQTILVHGANGGVGSTLVQLARANGIHVIGTASARNAEAVAQLGAT
ncbi:alcohol dehydrogenase catalytic domain-containing protein [Nocardia crassostreae]|uniref:alcohol dehydrogenase catalytic domain-containing protein n=1 Tax=Nocardia crassostreae TaxID=53428 RepID=UPI000AB88237|nr:alcohol dehydrogenase catalytic domain-containing protein [Nocardia crassostreae]